jgi:hypothetical protein
MDERENRRGSHCAERRKKGQAIFNAAQLSSTRTGSYIISTLSIYKIFHYKMLMLVSMILKILS